VIVDASSSIAGAAFMPILVAVIAVAADIGSVLCI
jgi:hypothetical protein